MKCTNCGKTVFEQMQLYEIYCTEGGANQLVDAFVCMNCGKVELYMPQELINKKINQRRMEEERRQEAEKQEREKEQLWRRMEELEKFLQDDNHTLKELKEAQKELTSIQDKLHIPFRRTYFNV